MACGMLHFIHFFFFFIAVWSCPREPMETTEGSQKETD